MAAARTRDRGFTLVELIAVIVIMGILALAAAPRFFAPNPFAQRAYSDELRAAIAYAQKHAIASGCDVRIRVLADAYSIERWAVCVPADHTSASSVVVRPGGAAFSGATPDTVSSTTLDVFFDKLGRPRAVTSAAELIAISASLQITVGSAVLQIEPETGFVRRL